MNRPPLLFRAAQRCAAAAVLFCLPCVPTGAQTGAPIGPPTGAQPAAGASQAAPAAPALSPQEQARRLAEFLRSHYTKSELHIPMRDGTRLYTAVYSPIAARFDDRGPYPLLMSRTPYSCAPYGADKIMPRVTANPNLLRGGYILVCQDVRGRWNSEGTWVEMTPSKDGHGIDESTDTSDTIDYLLKNVPGNNGKVGLVGISYPGFYTAASIVDSHPAIKAASPQAPIMDLYMGDDSVHGGAFMLQANHTFYAKVFDLQKNPLISEPKVTFEYPTRDLYTYFLDKGTLANVDLPERGLQPYLHDQIVHPNYDSFWKSRDLTPHMHGVKAAVLVVGGWFDAEDLAGPVSLFHSLDKLSPGAPEDTLIEGPWVHGGWARGLGDHLGNIGFGQDASLVYQNTVEAPFFDHWLKGKAWTEPAKAFTFETGSDVWKSYPAWPPPAAQPRTLYLQPGHGLAWTAPKDVDSNDSYVSDPANPVPYTTDRTSVDVPQGYMDADQRFVAGRADVLVYQTEPLSADVTVAGPVSPRLQVASTGTDADFDVKLIDVYPAAYDGTESVLPDGKAAPAAALNGYQMLIRGEPFRAKFRRSFEQPEALTPGKVTEIDFSMQDVNHTFRKGHRIMVQIQSSWFPLTDRNPQTFMDISKAQPGDFHQATETIFHQAGAASAIQLLVLPR